jgi:hypothetical protein
MRCLAASSPDPTGNRRPGHHAGTLHRLNPTMIIPAHPLALLGVAVPPVVFLSPDPPPTVVASGDRVMTAKAIRDTRTDTRFPALRAWAREALTRPQETYGSGSPQPVASLSLSWTRRRLAV